MKTLFVIPARGGSVGLPGKNIRPLREVPLIIYSLRFARLFSGDSDICVTTDAPDIAGVLECYGYRVPFLRPAELATDAAGSHAVMLHALDWYEQARGTYDRLVLLQPTSPFRRSRFLEDMFGLYHDGLDMVVSVKQSKANPYFNLFEEENGRLHLSKKSGDIQSRQSAPPVYQYNGSLYVINCGSLRRYASLALFEQVVKYEMPEAYSVDIDNAADWHLAEYLLDLQLVDPEG
ncbi:MAG TPA: acylneuraminate cytidylyltransferase family protein [Chitinophagaceae bacterium]|nr:acylneuraminate cytidylyltransferase family protein [Chitinophagaceae bacterium]